MTGYRHNGAVRTLSDRRQRGALWLWTTCLLAMMGPGHANADFTLGAPVNLGPAINTPATEAGVRISVDGLSLCFFRQGPGYPLLEGWIVTRATQHDPWGTPVSLGPWGDPASVYKSIRVMPSLTTADGLELYFHEEGRPGSYGGIDLWMLKRAATDADWDSCVNLGSVVNSSADEMCPAISSDGLELYFSGGIRTGKKYVRPGGYGLSDLWVTKRATRNDPWGTPVNLGPVVNSASQDERPYLSADGLVLFFDSQRAGGYGLCDIHMTRRATRLDAWGEPINLGPLVNSAIVEEFACVSPDGSTLYWDGAAVGAYNDLWQASITPIVDFNADDKADLVDLVMLIEDWGKSKSVCDIGPMPWGDGKVDIEDLKVFMTYYEKENPPAKP